MRKVLILSVLLLTVMLSGCSEKVTYETIDIPECVMIEVGRENILWSRKPMEVRVYNELVLYGGWFVVSLAL